MTVPTSAGPQSRVHPALLAFAGFSAALALPWLLIVAADAFPDKSQIAVFDDSVANWLTLRGTDALDVFFKAVSLLGDWILVAVIVAAVVRFLMRKQTAKAAGLVAAVGGAALLNVILAYTFQRAHSLAATGFESVAQGVNFPSGHSMVALVAYGMLAYFVAASPRSDSAKKAAAIVGAVLLVALIGFARVYLGIHSVSDVVLGFVAGAVWLFTSIRGYSRSAVISQTPAPSIAGFQPTT